MVPASTLDVIPSVFSTSIVVVINFRHCCSSSTKLVTLAGDSAMVEKPAEPIRVFSERDLAKEFEKAASMLALAQDWSIRMSAMQRIEGIVSGGTC